MTDELKKLLEEAAENNAENCPQYHCCCVISFNVGATWMHEQLNAKIIQLENIVLVSESATGVMHQATRIKELENEILYLKEESAKLSYDNEKLVEASCKMIDKIRTYGSSRALGACIKIHIKALKKYKESE